MLEGRKKRIVFSAIYFAVLFFLAVAMGAMAFFAMDEGDYLVMASLISIMAVLIMMLSFYAISTTRRGNLGRFYLDNVILVFCILLFLVFAGALTYYYLAK